MKIAFKFDGGRVVSHEVFERTFTIGRSEECRLSIDSEHFSREHCLVELVDKTLFITDLGSKNGVFVNHIRIPPRMRVTLDLKLPLYMGECFVSFDITSDTRDPDYLSLETHPHVAPDELYRPIEPPKRIPRRPHPSTVKIQEKKFLDGKGLVIAGLILAAVMAFQYIRTSQLHRKEATESSR